MGLIRHALATLATLALGCGGGSVTITATGSGGGITGAGGGTTTTATRTTTTRTGTGTGGSGGAGGATAAPGIRHIVVIVQENHTFDAYFGRYCTAPTYSQPTCTTGPACCERAPDKDPSGALPVDLDDMENAGYDPNHTQACELGEMNGGAMDQYTAGSSCSDPRNFALASDLVQPYWDFAAEYAIADRYFQPIVGQSSSNDMYLAQARYAFTDNDDYPDTNGHGCTAGAFGPFAQYTNKTVGDLMIDAGLGFAFYAEGYAAMKAASTCPAAPSDCPLHLPTDPCDYDPSDVPFEYYAQFADNPAYMKDYGDLAPALAAGTLPELSFVKGVGYHNEHPGYGTTLSQGVAFVTSVVGAILSSPVADDTLILVTWDEGGGFFDHVAPPSTSAVDSQPYGTRIPLLAIGRFARKNTISHVPLEHSSIVALAEYVFLHTTGQLGARDAVVHNLGSLLDPAQTGIALPE
jgi:phospholipase C